MRKLEVGEVILIDDLCTTRTQSFTEELGIEIATQAKLVLVTERSAAKIEYLQIENGTHEGEVVEITTTYRNGAPTLATARWLRAPIVLMWLKNAVWDEHRRNIHFAAVQTA